MPELLQEAIARRLAAWWPGDDVAEPLAELTADLQQLPTSVWLDLATEALREIATEERAVEAVEALRLANAAAAPARRMAKKAYMREFMQRKRSRERELAG